jgi:hypothetical protein
VSGDGKITLNEAYQFALNETLRRTVDTKGGAQHPSYDINLSGTGDVVMTDVRQTSATLVLDEDLEGRFFIRNAAHELIVELYKPRGRKVELGVEPGAYEVRIEQTKGSLVAKAQIADGGQVLLEPRQFGIAPVEATRQRGGAEGPVFGVAGRNRIELGTGMWQMSDSSSTSVGSGSTDQVFGLSYTRYVSEDLGITAGFQSAAVAVGVLSGSSGSFAGTAGIIALPIGMRWNPLRSRAHGPFRPFLAAKIGPAFGASEGAFSGSGPAFVGSHLQATLFTHAGLGFDYYPARSFVLGVNGGYNLLAKFAHPVGIERNHSGPEVNFVFGWLFGRGHPPAP